MRSHYLHNRTKEEDAAVEDLVLVAGEAVDVETTIPRKGDSRANKVGIIEDADVEMVAGRIDQTFNAIIVESMDIMLESAGQTRRLKKMQI